MVLSEANPGESPEQKPSTPAGVDKGELDWGKSVEEATENALGSCLARRDLAGVEFAKFLPTMESFQPLSALSRAFDHEVRFSSMGFSFRPEGPKGEGPQQSPQPIRLFAWSIR